MNSAKYAVSKSNQGEEGNQHGGDIEREAQAVGCAAGNGSEKVLRFLRAFFFFAHHHATSGFGHFRLGHQHFCHENCAGSGHNHGAQQMLRFDSEGDVGGHDSARNVCHAAGHHSHQLGAGEVGKKRANGERSFGLPHENAGSHIQRLCAARAHKAGHDFCGQLNDELHDSVVIKHGEKRGDKNDGWENLEGEEESH